VYIYHFALALVLSCSLLTFIPDVFSAVHVRRLAAPLPGAVRMIRSVTGLYFRSSCIDNIFHRERSIKHFFFEIIAATVEMWWYRETVYGIR